MMRHVVLTLCVFVFHGISGCSSVDAQRKKVAENIRIAKEQLISQPKNKLAIETIKRHLKGTDKEDSFDQTYACAAVRELGEDGIVFLEELIDLADSGDKFVEPEAVRAIGSIGREAKSAVSILEKKLQYSKTSASYYAAESIGKIGVFKKSTIKALRKGLTSESEFVRKNCKEALKIYSERKGEGK